MLLLKKLCLIILLLLLPEIPNTASTEGNLQRFPISPSCFTLPCHVSPPFLPPFLFQQNETIAVNLEDSIPQVIFLYFFFKKRFFFTLSLFSLFFPHLSNLSPNHHSFFQAVHNEILSARMTSLQEKSYAEARRLMHQFEADTQVVDFRCFFLCS